MNQQETSKSGETSYNQAMRGLTIFGLGLCAVKASGPYLSALPAESAQWVGLAMLIVIAYGELLAVTSEPALEAVRWAKSKLQARGWTA